MNCPERCLVSRKHLKILHWQAADVRRKYVTWGEVFNPLRYEISVGAGPGRYWTWNDNAWMRVKWVNFWFSLRKMCWLLGHDFQTNKYSDHRICKRCFAHSKEAAVMKKPGMRLSTVVFGVLGALVFFWIPLLCWIL